tara:strand:- start:142 stop:747 length:606 start_codon:yes stop_codon:yes gene_type:complete
MNNFPRFNPNEPALDQLSTTNLNLVSGGQKSNQIQPGVGYRLTQTGGGTTMNITRRIRRAAPIVGNLLIIQGTDTGKYQITTGTVNSEDPTLGGVAIGGDPDAEPVVAIPELTVTADTYVWIKCVGVFADPDTYTITIETESTTSPPSGTTITATGFTSFFKIGKIDYTAGTPATYDITNNHSGGNLNVESFGNVNLWFKS